MTGDDRRRRNRPGVEADHSMSNDLGRHDEQRVVDEELVVVFETRAERRAQQAGPELALEDDGGILAVLDVEPFELGVGECVSRAADAQAALYFSRCRRDRLDGRQGALEPDGKTLGICRRGRQLEVRDLFELVVGEVVEAPLGTVGENTGVALCEGSCAVAHITGKLFDRLITHAVLAQVALDLDNREADLDVDTAAAADLRFEFDDIEVAFAEVQTTVEEKRLNVGLRVGFGRLRAGGEAAGESGKVERHAPAVRRSGRHDGRRVWRIGLLAAAGMSRILCLRMRRRRRACPSAAHRVDPPLGARNVVPPDEELGQVLGLRRPRCVEGELRLVAIHVRHRPAHVRPRNEAARRCGVAGIRWSPEPTARWIPRSGEGPSQDGSRPHSPPPGRTS